MKTALFIIIFICLQACKKDSHEAYTVQLPRAPTEPKEWPQEAWHLFGEHGINILPAWKITQGSPDITIAVIDQGFLPQNSAFISGKCHARTIMDGIHNPKKSTDHGAMVASVISTCEDNPLGLIGINAHSSMLWIEQSQGNMLSDIELLRWTATDPTLCSKAQFIKCSEPNQLFPHVINMSYGADVKRRDLSRYRKIVLDAVITVRDLDSILVAAAGNKGVNAEKVFPASATGIITAGFTTIDGVAQNFSNWGETVEIMAPGADIPVASKDGKALVDGSSLAAPMVTGVISLMRSVYPALNWKTAVYFLQATASPMDCEAYCFTDRTPERRTKCEKDCCVGALQTCTPGRMNAGAAVEAAKKANTEGLPAVALVDTDTYWIELKHDTMRGQFKLFNVGGKKGSYHISSPDALLRFEGKNSLDIELAPQGQRGDALVIHVKRATSQVWQESEIHIRSPESGHLATFSDELVIYTGSIR